MKLICLISPVFVALMSSTLLLAQSTGPDDRQITDPQSISSASNPRARPVPIDDLYFTRSVSSASWSPDGKAVNAVPGSANLVIPFRFVEQKLNGAPPRFSTAGN